MAAPPAGPVALRRPGVLGIAGFLLASILASVVVPACSGPAPDVGGDAGPPAVSPPPGSRAVTFEAADGTKLAGRLFGAPDAGVAIVMAHEYPGDQRGWWPLAESLAAQDAAVLTFNFRGYCPGGDAGCSQGAKDPAAAPDDVLGAAAFLREEAGADLILMGASMGGTASLIAASELADPPLGVATLSAPVRFEGMDAEAALGAVTSATLFIAGTNDYTAAADAQELYDAAQLPKRIDLATTADHGTALLEGNQGARVEQLLTGFVQQVRAAA